MRNVYKIKFQGMVKRENNRIIRMSRIVNQSKYWNNNNPKQNNTKFKLSLDDLLSENLPEVDI